MKTYSLKILVMGGSGFVSGTLARTAVASGHQVWTRKYYQIIADILGVTLTIEETPAVQYLSDCPPGNESFICHRTYDLKQLHNDNLKVPATPIAYGLQAHVKSLLY